MSKLGEYKMEETITGELQSWLESCTWREDTSVSWTSYVVILEFYKCLTTIQWYLIFSLMTSIMGKKSMLT